MEMQLKNTGADARSGKLFGGVFGVMILAAVMSTAAYPGPAYGQSSPLKSQLAAGKSALADGKLERARAAYDRAIVLDPSNLEAYRGQVRVSIAMKDWKFAKTAAVRGMEISQNKREIHSFWPLLAKMHADRKADGWYEEVKTIYYDALRESLYLDGNSEFRTIVGLAALDAGDIPQAVKHLRVALGKSGPHKSAAQAGLDRAQGVFRASLGKTSVTKIAVLASITRNQVATLLFEDFDLPTFLPDADMKTPQPGETGANNDYGGEKNAERIRGMHRLQLREFSIVKGKFRPKDKVTREEFAMLLEDLIIRRYGDKAIGRKFIGSASPFSDLPATRPSFNAMLNSISRGLMTASAGGKANPNGTITGADAVLALRNLRSLIR